jgi:hypothetical protein
MTLHFPKPDGVLRRQLFDRWDPDLRAAVPVDRVLADTAGMSFAEMDELKNLLVLHFLAAGAWDWAAAVRQFRENRDGFDDTRRGRRVGFGLVALEEPVGSGQGVRYESPH